MVSSKRYMRWRALNVADLLRGIAIAMFFWDVSIGFGITTSRIGMLALLGAALVTLPNSLLLHLKLHVRLLLLSIIGFLTISIVSTMLSSSTHINPVGAVWTWFGLIIVTLLVAQALDNKNVIRTGVTSFWATFVMGGGVCVAVLGTAISLGLPPGGFAIREMVDNIEPGLNRISNGLALSVMLMFWASRLSGGAWMKTLFGTYFSIVLITIIYLGSRQSLLMLGVFGLAWFAATISIRPSVFGILKLALVVPVAIYADSQLSIMEAVESRFLKLVENTSMLSPSMLVDASGLARLEALDAGARLFRGNEVVGIGSGAFAGEHGKASHNSFLKAAVELGVLSIFPFVIFAISMALGIRSADPGVKMALALMFGAILIGGMLNDILFTPMSFVCIIAFIAFANNGYEMKYTVS